MAVVFKRNEKQVKVESVSRATIPERSFEVTAIGQARQDREAVMGIQTDQRLKRDFSQIEQLAKEHAKTIGLS